MAVHSRPLIDPGAHHSSSTVPGGRTAQSSQTGTVSVVSASDQASSSPVSPPAWSLISSVQVPAAGMPSRSDRAPSGW